MLILKLLSKKERLSIAILVRNHLGIPQLAKPVPHTGSYAIDYGELLSIIEGYTVGMVLSEMLLLERDPLLTV